MKRMLKPVIRKGAGCITLITALMFLGACSEEETTTTGPAENGRRTVLVYMNARNSLYGNVKQDSLELVEGSKNMNANDRLLLYVCKDSLSYLYRISNGKTQMLLQCEGSQSASNPKQLEMLLKWTKEQFPSQSYGLVMWSHSDGWVPSTHVTRTATRSFGIDVGADGNPWSNRTNDGKLGYQMDITDMASAISNSGVHPEFIFFDSCLMQCVEVAYDLRNVTDWVIASPAQIPSIGAQYTDMMNEAFYQQPLNPQAFTEGYVTQSSTYPEYGDMGVVLSAVKTGKLEELASITKTMIEKYVSGSEEPDLNGVLAYDKYKGSYSYRPEFYDMQSAMCHFITDSSDKATWMAALQACALYPAATAYVNFWSNYPEDRLYLTPGEFSGISMFVPQQRYTTNASRCMYGDLNQDFANTEWAKASGWSESAYLKMLTGTEEK